MSKISKEELLRKVGELMFEVSKLSDALHHLTEQVEILKQGGEKNERV